MNEKKVRPWTRIPDYINAREMSTGLLAFDDDKCHRCGICTFICPARSIRRDTRPGAWRKGLPYLEPIAPGITNCVGCGCCQAACPEQAIQVQRGFAPGHFYQRLTQTRELSYPRRYGEDSANPGASPRAARDRLPTETTGSPAGRREKLRRSLQKGRLAVNAVSGLARFARKEMRAGRLKKHLQGAFTGQGTDISWARLMEEAAADAPDKTFLLYNNESFTYQEMDENANRLANFLKGMGGGPGRGLGILMRNSPRYLDAFLGLQKIGMYAVTINPELKGDGLAYVVNHSEIEFLLIDAELWESYQGIADRLPNLKAVIVNDVEPEAKGIAIPGSAIRLSRAYAESTARPQVEIDPEGICLIIYTSGTTGPPKGVVYRYNRTGVTLISVGAHILLKKDDVYFTYLSLCHGNALFITFTMSMAMRATMALARKFSASRFWEMVHGYDATVFNTIGSIIPILMKQPPGENDRSHRVRFVFSAACPAEMWPEFEKRFGVRLYEGYGAVDGGGKGIMNLGTGPVGSIGRPARKGMVRIVDENDNDVPQGVPGELLFKVSGGPSKVEYFKNPEATQKKSRDGWLRTGDLVRQDAEGYLYFVGRNTESMRKGGENVSAYEVEQVVMKHADVEEVAVYAVASELAEDEIMAAVKPVAGRPLDPVELRGFLADQLAKYAVPRYVRVVEDFPKTNTHRIIKSVLEKEGVTADTYDAQRSSHN